MTNKEAFKRLLSKIVSPPSEKGSKVRLSYEGLKRTPQFLRQALRLATSTVDEEFEELLTQLNTLELHGKKILRLLCVYQGAVHMCLENLEKVILNVRSIIDLKPDERKAVPRATLLLRIIHLQNVLETLRLSIGEIFSTVPVVLEERVKTLLNRILTLRNQIRKRDLALVDYDKVFDKFDTMTISKAAGNMTIKQSQHYFATERKLEAFRLEYDKYNSALKKEMPCFIYFGRRFMDEAFTFIFYTQVNVASQIDSDLHVLLPEFADVLLGLPVHEFATILTEKFNEDNLFEAPQFNFLTEDTPQQPCIEKSVETSRLPCVESSNITIVPVTHPQPEYYEALYDFTAQQDDDISFNKADIIAVFEKSGEWWRGSIDGNSGMFPSNYVKKKCD